MKRAELGLYVLYGSGRQLMQVIGIGEGRTVILRDVRHTIEGGPICEACGQPLHPDVHVLEDSPLFQREAQPVPTFTE